jgi:hypothetical protein
MKVTVSIQISLPCCSDTTRIVAEFERHNPVSAASLGLNLGEAKELLRNVQRELVQAQLANELESQRKCGDCGKLRWVKERRQVLFKSLFGGIKIAIGRLEACSCARSTSCTETLAVPRFWVPVRIAR